MHNRYLSIYGEPKVKYLHWSIILLVALFMSHVVVTESQQKPVLVLVHQLNYRVAMAFSWPFTFMMMIWIHYCTIILDNYMPWTANWPLRILVQFILGVVVVLAIDVIVVKYYFSKFNNDFSKSGYMEIEFPIIRWMVLCMNLFYICWFFAANFFKSSDINQRLNKYISDLNDQNEVDFQAQKIEVKLGKKIVHVELREIACFERQENIGYVYLFDGRTYNIDLTLNELVKLLGSSHFYQINRSVMMAFNAVEGYEKVKNQQANIILKEGLTLTGSLLVSRERFNGFKKNFEKFKRS